MSHALTIRTKLTIHYYTIIQNIYMFFYISSEDNYIRKLVIVIVLSHAHDQQNKLTCKSELLECCSIFHRHMIECLEGILRRYRRLGHPLFWQHKQTWPRPLRERLELRLQSSWLRSDCLKSASCLYLYSQIGQLMNE